MKRNVGPRRKTIDDFLANVSPEKRAALEKLRKAIHAAAPGVEECISYGIPGFRLNGRYLMGMGATASHCAFYIGSTLKAHKVDLKGYDTSTGTIRFQPDKPLPRALVRKLVRSRIKQRGGRK
jgi:uncharacterized protein YdhG (YjbR/CyaY superfamily)